MKNAHRPVIIQRPDGRWELHCPDCTESHETTVLIGLDLPVESKEVADLLLENHLRPFAQAS